MLTAAREMRDRVLETWPQKRALLREELPFVCDRVDALLASIPFFTKERSVGGVTEAGGREEVV